MTNVKSLNRFNVTSFNHVSAGGENQPVMGGIQIQNQPREVSIALSVAEAAQGRDESTEREPAAFHINVGGQWLVEPADRPRTGDQPGDGRQICPAEPVKTSHRLAR